MEALGYCAIATAAFAFVAVSAYHLLSFHPNIAIVIANTFAKATVGSATSSLEACTTHA